ncbi:hypothetical protein TcWFU_006308 [Taenia crassiceps]|uniref:Uncharacterized protein n=1 Tax=Taenia crassiceps TaxID=6207 RepID=A0ABR4QRL4_9CEST
MNDRRTYCCVVNLKPLQPESLKTSATVMFDAITLLMCRAATECSVYKQLAKAIHNIIGSTQRRYHSILFDVCDTAISIDRGHTIMARLDDGHLASAMIHALA